MYGAANYSVAQLTVCKPNPLESLLVAYLMPWAMGFSISSRFSPTEHFGPHGKLGPLPFSSRKPHRTFKVETNQGGFREESNPVGDASLTSSPTTRFRDSGSLLFSARLAAVSAFVPTFVCSART